MKPDLLPGSIVELHEDNWSFSMLDFKKSSFTDRPLGVVATMQTSQMRCHERISIIVSVVDVRIPGSQSPELRVYLLGPSRVGWVFDMDIEAV